MNNLKISHTHGYQITRREIEKVLFCGTRRSKSESVATVQWMNIANYKHNQIMKLS